jgi:hypothetical protein
MFLGYLGRRKKQHATGRMTPHPLKLQPRPCVFRMNVTGLFGIVTGDFGNVTGHFGNVTERTGRQDWRCA